MAERQGSLEIDSSALKKAYRISVATFRKTATIPAATIIFAELYRRTGIVFNPKETNGLLNIFFTVVDNELYRYTLLAALSGLVFLMVWQSKKKLFLGEYRGFKGIEKFKNYKYLEGYPAPVQTLMVVHKVNGLFCVLMSVVGFIVFARSGKPVDFYLCLLVTAGLLWYSYPRYEAWERFIKKLARSPERAVSGTAPGISFPNGSAADAAMDADIIVYADRLYRKNFIILLILFLVLVGSLVYGFITYMEYLDILHRTAPSEAVHKFVIALWVAVSSIALAASGIGVYFISVAVRVMRSDRLPPPGMKVLTDTKVKTGMEARVKAASTIMLAVTLIIFAVVLLISLPKALDKTLAETQTETHRQQLQKGGAYGNER